MKRAKRDPVKGCVGAVLLSDKVMSVELCQRRGKVSKQVSE